jgi:hypothetical protein
LGRDAVGAVGGGVGSKVRAKDRFEKVLFVLTQPFPRFVL